MTTDTAVIPEVDGDADLRWREWQARGAASDRREAARARIVMLLIAAAVGAWFVVQLT
jgi:hypothetical protein